MNRKHNLTKTPTIDPVEILMTDKAISMVNIDALISILIQKGVFTKSEFDSVKQAIKETNEYREISNFIDTTDKALQTGFTFSVLSDREINELLKALDENEVEMREAPQPNPSGVTQKSRMPRKRNHARRSRIRDIVFIIKRTLGEILFKLRTGKFPRKPTKAEIDDAVSLMRSMVASTTFIKKGRQHYGQPKRRK